MAIIGTFTRIDNGYQGRVVTLMGQFPARIVKIDKPSSKGPHYRVLAGTGAEVGAAWEKTATETGQVYLSVTLDDPSFAAPIHAALFDGEGDTHNLVWNRTARR